MVQIGLSLSPGGLLLPYHCGVLQCLQEQQQRQSQQLPVKPTIVAGSSAGSIAATIHGCDISPIQGLESTIKISEYCHVHHNSIARGKLLPLLQHELQTLVMDTQFQHLVAMQQQDGSSSDDTSGGSCWTGIAYHQIFPRPSQSYLQTEFTSREDLFRAVQYSCMFPFFTTNWPFIVEWTKRKTSVETATSADDDDDTDTDDDDRTTNRKRKQLNFNAVRNILPNSLPSPRIFVDGYFTEPRERFGCPDLSQWTLSMSSSSSLQDRTVVATNNDDNDDGDDDDDGDNKQNKKNKNQQQPLVDRTIVVSCLPHELFGMSSVIDVKKDCISPLQRSKAASVEEENRLPIFGPNNDETLAGYLLRVATTPTSRTELTNVYEMGYQDTEQWLLLNEKKEQQHQRRRQRQRQEDQWAVGES